MEFLHFSNKVPQEFPFPFKPYDIQNDLMKELYKCLEDKQLGILESPTGTGKSMSLLCGAMKWLVDYEQTLKESLELEIKRLEQELTNIESNTSNDWFNEHSSTVKLRQNKYVLQSHLNKILMKEKQIENMKMSLKENLKKSPVKYFNVRKEKENIGVDIEKNREVLDEEILLDEVIDEDDSVDGLSDNEIDGCMDEDYEDGGIKIYFCSRTHTQLSQFIGEVQKSPYSDIQVIPLASRQVYCVNESVRKLKHVSLINERCQELQKKKKGRIIKTETGKTLKKSKCSGGCPYLQQANVELLEKQCVTHVQDIESIVELGKQEKSCPYYATRNAVKYSKIVVLPYNTILRENTRNACGIKLKNNIVIIDEAHNLLDTIGNIHSCEISGLVLTHSHSQLLNYKNKYHTRFSPANLLFLNQLIFIVNKLLTMIGGKCGSAPSDANKKPTDVKLFTIPDFITTAEIDNMNMFKILETGKKNRITHKLQGFLYNYVPQVVQQVPKESGIKSFLENISKNKNKKDLEPRKGVPSSNVNTNPEVTCNNPTLQIFNFIETLTNNCEDGRIVCNRQVTVGKSSLKYLLLNPAAHFADIVRQARCVVVAGGTMQPLTEFRDQLFVSAGAELARVRTFSCGHVIHPDNILPLVVCSGPTGKQINFSYQNRDSNCLVDELGRILINATNVIPAGIVCFYPSYDFEMLIYEKFEKNGVLEKIKAKKRLFREPRKSADVEKVLNDYTECIKGGMGAILFSVVGGKLSEGLNFSDELGRCVVVVGMPYPNIKSPELQEKMRYLDINSGPGSGQTYYENLCMKAVNQSIGRAVRHKDDYASVLLLDYRYSKQTVLNNLPQWIKSSLIVENKFGPVMSRLAKFFNKHKI